MSNKLTFNESWTPFLVNLMIKFIELNKAQIGEQKTTILCKFSKGQSFEKIAADEKLSTTRIRQLLDIAAAQLEKLIASANIEEHKSLKEVCKGIESENNSLRQTLKIHGIEDSTPISKLSLSKRAQTVLNFLNVISIEHLCTFQVEDIMKVPNAGIKTITEIETALENLGLHLNYES